MVENNCWVEAYCSTTSKYRIELQTGFEYPKQLTSVFVKPQDESFNPEFFVSIDTTNRVCALGLGSLISERTTLKRGEHRLEELLKVQTMYLFTHLFSTPQNLPELWDLNLAIVLREHSRPIEGAKIKQVYGASTGSHSNCIRLHPEVLKYLITSCSDLNEQQSKASRQAKLYDVRSHGTLLPPAWFAPSLLGCLIELVSYHSTK
jgi:hypothetical protein